VMLRSSLILMWPSAFLTTSTAWSSLRRNSSLSSMSLFLALCAPSTLSNAKTAMSASARAEHGDDVVFLLANPHRDLAPCEPRVLPDHPDDSRNKRGIVKHVPRPPH